MFVYILKDSVTLDYIVLYYYRYSMLFSVPLYEYIYVILFISSNFKKHLIIIIIVSQNI